jgi:hypothetical protein
VTTLVDKIAGIADGSQPVSLAVNNISSLNATDLSTIERSLETEMGKHFHLLPQAPGTTQIVITLSEGATGYVWVAQVRGGSAEQTAMVSIPKKSTAAARRERPAMALERKLVWSQPQPFLDFIVPDGTPADGPSLVVLDPSQVVFYSSVNSQWVAGKAIPLSPSAPLPRDTRGMIWQSAGEIEMLIPGESCSGLTATLPELLCTAYPSTNSIMHWPLITDGTERQDAGFQSDRNFFGGLLSAGGTVDNALPAFYTAAVRSAGTGLDWLIATVDGKARLYDSSPKLVATFSGWGDQVATIDTGCNDSWQVLTTGTGDSTEPDHIQIYDIRNYPQSQRPAGSPESWAPPEAVAVGQPLDFSGPVVALWPSADLKSARVVSLNLQTEVYEGSLISVSCGD